MKTSLSTNGRPRQRGSALVELAVVLPLFALVFAALLHVGAVHLAGRKALSAARMAAWTPRTRGDGALLRSSAEARTIATAPGSRGLFPELRIRRRHSVTLQPRDGR